MALRGPAPGDLATPPRTTSRSAPGPAGVGRPVTASAGPLADFHLAIRSTERRDAAGAVRSVGGKGDSHADVAAESLIGLYKTELIRRRSPWKGLDDVEPALEYVDWFHHRRLHGACGDILRSSSRTTTTVRSPASPRTSRQNRASINPGAVQGHGRGPRLSPSASSPAPVGR